jgi:hypothetical protein
MASGVLALKVLAQENGAGMLDAEVEEEPKGGCMRRCIRMSFN